MEKCHCITIDREIRQRLIAAGCCMPFENSERSEDLIITAHKAEDSHAYDRRAGAEYAVSVRVTNHSYRELEIERFRLRVPWVARLCWPGHPGRYCAERKHYRFDSGLTYPLDEVLNHRLGGDGRLRPGESMGGLLLAYTMFDRISPEYIHNDLATARVFVVDQFGRKHRGEVEIRVDRSATMRPLRTLQPRSGGLYDSSEVPRELFSRYLPATNAAPTNHSPGLPVACADNPNSDVNTSGGGSFAPEGTADIRNSPAQATTDLCKARTSPPATAGH